jgi:hypothetical protein
MAPPRFKVEIQGEALEEARHALNAAGVPTIGPTMTWRSGGGTETAGHTMLAVLEALSPEQAEARVREALPAEGEYTVSPAEPLVPEAE